MGRSGLFGLAAKHTAPVTASAKEVVLEDRAILFERGDPGDGCYWLEEGAVKITIVSPNGELRILAVLGPGAVIGELAMIDGLPRSATVEALRRCRFSFVSREAFLRCLDSDPALYKLIVRTLAERLRLADEEAAAASFLPVRARVARALLHLAHHLGEPTDRKDMVVVRQELRQADIAALAGVVRESVSRTLRTLRQTKVLGEATRSTYLIHLPSLEREAAVPE